MYYCENQASGEVKDRPQDRPQREGGRKRVAEKGLDGSSHHGMGQTRSTRKYGLWLCLSLVPFPPSRGHKTVPFGAACECGIWSVGA